MKLVSVMFGTERDHNGNALGFTDTEIGKRLDVVRDHLVKLAGGFTESETLGGWKNEHGEVVTERGRRFDIVCGDEATARAARGFVPCIAALFRQGVVLVTVNECLSYFEGL